MTVESWTDWRELVRDLTNALENKNAEVQRLQGELAAANTTLKDPARWMQWCDIRVLERAEAAESSLARVEAARAALEQQNRELVESLGVAADKLAALRDRRET